MVEIIRNAIEQRHGLWTPRQKLGEMHASPKAKAESWFRKRLRRIEAHLSTVRFQGRPILDEKMSANAVDAVLEEAWDAVEHGPDELQQMIREMAAQGRA